MHMVGLTDVAAVRRLDRDRSRCRKRRHGGRRMSHDSSTRSASRAAIGACVLALGAGRRRSRDRSAAWRMPRCSEDIAAVRALLDQGADVNAAAGRRHDRAALGRRTRRHGAGDAAAERAAPASTAVTRLGGYTPLHVAARGGHGAVVAGAHRGQAPSVGARRRPARRRSISPRPRGSAVGRALLDAGAEVDVREPQWGQTPLMFAAAAGRTDVVKTLHCARRRPSAPPARWST